PSLGHLVQSCPGREVLRRLPASVESDHEGAGRLVRDEQAVGARADGAVLERFVSPGGARRGKACRQPQDEQRGKDPRPASRHDQRRREGKSTRERLTSHTPRGVSRTAGRKSAARKKSVKAGSW